MARRRGIGALVRRVVEGRSVEEAARSLAAEGKRAVMAILDAKRRGPPAGRDPRDWHDDLTSVLWHVARTDPTPLVALLDEGHEAGRDLAWALGGSTETSAVDALVRALEHRDGSVRWAAVCSLARTRRKRSIEPLVRRLRDRSGRVRFAALEALASYDDPSVIPALRAALAERSLPTGAKRIAEEAIARLGG